MHVIHIIYAKSNAIFGCWWCFSFFSFFFVCVCYVNSFLELLLKIYKWHYCLLLSLLDFFMTPVPKDYFLINRLELLILLYYLKWTTNNRNKKWKRNLQHLTDYEYPMSRISLIATLWWHDIHEWRWI